MKIINKTIKDIKSFTIDRSKWVRGGKGGDSRLLNKNGNMCCLGQYAKACGFSDNDIYDLADPADLAMHLEGLELDLNKMWLANLNQEDIEVINWETKLINSEIDKYLEETFVYNKFITSKLIEENDGLYLGGADGDTIMSEKEREKRIKAGFAKIGVKVRFKN